MRRGLWKGWGCDWVDEVDGVDRVDGMDWLDRLDRMDRMDRVDRDALLPKLVSGELRVKDAARFVEGHVG